MVIAILIVPCLPTYDCIILGITPFITHHYSIDTSSQTCTTILQKYVVTDIVVVVDVIGVLLSSSSPPPFETNIYHLAFTSRRHYYSRQLSRPLSDSSHRLIETVSITFLSAKPVTQHNLLLLRCYFPLMIHLAPTNSSHTSLLPS
jgi:hypothetical protein